MRTEGRRRYIAHPHAAGVGVAALESDLRVAVRGEVRFDAGSRGAYATDASNFRQPPLGVVLPADVDDVVAAVAACREHGAPITNRGGGTALAGQTTNVSVVIDNSKYLRHVVELNPGERWAWVEPGCVLDTLRSTAEEHGLTFGPDPATHNRCTLGGMIGNNSCGVHSVTAGRTAENVEELDVLLYDGTRMVVGATHEDELERTIARGGRQGLLYRQLRDLRDRYAELIRERFPDIPRRVSGYSLEQLLPENGFHVARALVGSESTCVTVLGAKVRLVPSPPVRALVVVGFDDVFQAADRVPQVLEHQPIGLEGIDHKLIANMHKKGLRVDDLSLLPSGEAFLLVEFGGETRDEARDKAQEFVDAVERRAPECDAELFDDPEQEKRVWEVREAGLGATARVPGEDDTWPGWEDSAVAVDRLGSYLRKLGGLYDKYGYDAALYGHFGQGCVHTRINFDLQSQQGIERYRAFLAEAAELVVAHRGSLSGEHGDGQQRGPLLDKMYGPELVRAFEEFKGIWDPEGRMNPGKVVDRVRRFDLAENLRIGTQYRPPNPSTHFQFPDDGGSFARATLRCVGVGKCRRTDGGIMCPSYMVTLEEEHSTRGRARLLFEMLEGDVVHDGWRSKAVFDALDLCLACKGCKNECPVNVDMATYKAEFLSHHWKRRLRPRHAYALGLIMYAARAASRFPRLANFVAHSKLVSPVVKRLGGLAPQRPAPRFAADTFRHWFTRRGPSTGERGEVVLYTDTFTNYFHTDVAQAAVDVLEAAGFGVSIPDRVVCCGRPLYDYGMLPTAKRLLRQNLEVLRPHIEAGAPIVVLEPSCAVTFRDELGGLYPNDLDAQRLSAQVMTLAELLDQRAPDWQPPETTAQVLVQHHCHQKSVIGMEAEKRVLDRLGADWRMPDSGCCGLAGSWGYEAQKYHLSMRAGERVILPAVRQADRGTVVMADGFSCRTQIEHGTGRRAVHLAQLIQEHLGRAEP